MRRMAMVGAISILMVPGAEGLAAGPAPQVTSLTTGPTTVTAGTPVTVQGSMTVAEQPAAILWNDPTVAGDAPSFQYPFDPNLDLVQGSVTRARPGAPLTMTIKVAPSLGADSGPKPFQWFRWPFHLGQRWYFIEFAYRAESGTPGWRGSWYYCNLALGSNCIHGTTPPFPVTWDAAARTLTGQIPLAHLAAVQPDGRLIHDSMRPFSSQYPPESGYDFDVLLNRHDASAPFEPYDVPIESVFVAVAPINLTPGESDYAPVSTSPGEGAMDVSFTGSASTAGLAPGSYNLWVKACFGPCAYRLVPVTIG